MASMTKINTKQLFLGGMLVVLAILLLRQYLPMIQLPTNGRIQEETQRLQSRMDDLAVQKKMNSDWELELDRLRKKAAIFWVRTKTSMPVEQEVLEEFNNVARLASVNIQSKEPRLVKVPNSNFVQEVEIRLDMRSVSMKEFTRLLREIERNRRKFYWASCKIDPDNVQKPTGIRVSGRLKAYVLTEDCDRIFGGSAAAYTADASAPATNAAQAAKSVNRKVSARGSVKAGRGNK